MWFWPHLQGEDIFVDDLRTAWTLIMLCANISPASGMVQRMVLPLAFDVFYITGSVLWTMREIILRVYHNQTSVCNVDDSVLWTVREIILRVYHNETSFFNMCIITCVCYRLPWIFFHDSYQQNNHYGYFSFVCNTFLYIFDCRNINRLPWLSPQPSYIHILQDATDWCHKWRNQLPRLEFYLKLFISKFAR